MYRRNQGHVTQLKVFHLNNPCRSESCLSTDLRGILRVLKKRNARKREEALKITQESLRELKIESTNGVVKCIDATRDTSLS